ncbi:DUF3084 domain-containing protein [Acetonema longum]|uniref:Chromosome partition protein Smc n=1 Tax=Acetonema longum DSM 6540 TaxID=1009370 RepID=F7NLZ5_9FIRM|nr:DUF3084 domain-containing protein [Acetonema longum]EGO62921.1 hypothetical protein ALO_15607 [Acetonema longum DSM 6540]
MIYGIGLVVTLVIMGGMIAYIGDHIGSKVGKRKLTVFGLRPKHTSILVTIVTGILIAACTLGVLTLTSNYVRTALFGMEALRTELTALSHEVETQNVELAASHKALAEKNAEYSTLSTKVRETTERLQTIVRELKTVAAERDRAAQALEKLNAEYIASRRDLEKSRQEVKTLQETKQQLDKRVAALNREKAGLEQEVSRLNEVANTLKQGIQTVREGSILFRAGEAISAAAIKGGQKQPDVEEALKKALAQTNLYVLAKMDIRDKNIDAIWVSQNEFNKVVRQLTDSSQDYVVRVSAAGNTVYGEPVVAQLDLFPNYLVYAKGAKVYSEEISLDRDPQKAEELVLNFLQQVNAQAIKQGILPDPIQGTVGVVSGSHLFDTVNKVKRSRDTLELSAIATKDIYTIGPLQIEIKVRTLSSPSND